ncbi:hypothetical protein ACYBSK_24250 [Streptomyces sp. BYX5S]
MTYAEHRGYPGQHLRWFHGLPVVEFRGTALSDEGGAALLAGRPLTHLRSLDLHHHFMSPEVVERFRSELSSHSVAVDLAVTTRGRGWEGRCVSVGE